VERMYGSPRRAEVIYGDAPSDAKVQPLDTASIVVISTHIDNGRTGTTYAVCPLSFTAIGIGTQTLQRNLLRQMQPTEDISVSAPRDWVQSAFTLDVGYEQCLRNRVELSR
jgi:hypothetical protein